MHFLPTVTNGEVHIGFIDSVTSYNGWAATVSEERINGLSDAELIEKGRFLPEAVRSIGGNAMFVVRCAIMEDDGLDPSHEVACLCGETFTYVGMMLDGSVMKSHFSEVVPDAGIVPGWSTDTKVDFPPYTFDALARYVIAVISADVVPIGPR